MPKKTGNTQRILRMLDELGPMTRLEICRELEPNAQNISSLVSALLREQPRNPRRIHISGWTFEIEGERHYPRAIYALGDRPDAKRPRPLSRTEIVARYRAALRTKYQTNSVFNLARTQKEIHAVSKMRQPQATHTREPAHRARGLAPTHLQGLPSLLADPRVRQPGQQDAG
jgi:hypothetical protein